MKENYEVFDAQRGVEEMHIGGKLIIDDGGAVEGLPMQPAENIADSMATTVAALKNDFNDLLDAMKAAGLMEGDE